MRMGLVVGFDGGPKGGPDFIRSFSQATERAGFASLWLPEHIVFLDQYESTYPYPSTPGATGPTKMPVGPDQGLYDPFFAAVAVGMCTTSLRVGSSVTLVNVRHPLVMAKEIATLDGLIGGRFDFGVGVGWLKEEYDALGIPFAKRGKIADEYLAALRVIWTERRPTFHGQFVSFDEVVSFPKPVQRPHPPILVGGESEAALRRTARYGDGWYGWNMTIDELRTNLKRLDEVLAEEKRSRSDIKIQIGLRHTGDTDSLNEYCDAAASLGVEELTMSLTIRHASHEESIAQFAEALSVRARSMVT